MNWKNTSGYQQSCKSPCIPGTPCPSKCLLHYSQVVMNKVVAGVLFFEEVQEFFTQKFSRKLTNEYVMMPKKCKAL